MIKMHHVLSLFKKTSEPKAYDVNWGEASNAPYKQYYGDPASKICCGPQGEKWYGPFSQVYVDGFIYRGPQGPGE